MADARPTIRHPALSGVLADSGEIAVMHPTQPVLPLSLL